MTDDPMRQPDLSVGSQIWPRRHAAGPGRGQVHCAGKQQSEGEHDVGCTVERKAQADREVLGMAITSTDSGPPRASVYAEKPALKFTSLDDS
jgi:hypothetical protein